MSISAKWQYGQMASDGAGRRIAVYRRRRGLSQAALAGLVGRSESWLSQVERGIRGVDRMSVLLDLSRVLDVEVPTLTGTSWRLAPNSDQVSDRLVEVREALTRYAILTGEASGPPSADAVDGTVATLHRRYQAARYAHVTAALPAVIGDADALSAGSDNEHVSAPAYVRAYVLASKQLTKLGVVDLAALTADRAAMVAGRTDSPALRGAAAYQVVVAQLLADQVEQGERLAIAMAEHLSAGSRPGVPTLASVAGSLWLIAAVIAARRTERWEAQQRLDQAQRLADLLGSDANHAWTAFGPTNVAIHRVSVAAELGEPAGALAAAAGVDLERLPSGLASRRAQVRLDLAWAHAQRKRDAEATLHLLDAEAVAPETVAYNPIAREIIRAMLNRARGGQSTTLSALATRAGVLQ